MSLIGIGFLLFFLIWFGVIGYSPDIENLQNPINKSASQIYSADGKIIGTYNADKANRIPVPYSKLSPYLVKALVATEDERFYEHSGIDFIALGRAIVKRGLMGRQVPVAAVRSHSSLPSSSIPILLSPLPSDCCRNPSSGSQPLSLSATSPKKRSSRSISTISTSSMVLWASRQQPTPILIRSPRILPSMRQHCSSVCARTPRCSICALSRAL